MTKYASISAALVCLAALTAAPAQAALNDTGLSPDGVQRECSFNAEAGGYVCEAFVVEGSLSDLNDRNAKKQISIQFLPPVVYIPFQNP